MSDEAAFRALLAEYPDDDTARLVFADWLDEHDRAAEAGALRQQVASLQAQRQRAAEERARAAEEQRREDERWKRQEEWLRQREERERVERARREREDEIVVGFLVTAFYLAIGLVAFNLVLAVALR